MLDVGEADDLGETGAESVNHSGVGPANRDLLGRDGRNVGPDESDADTCMSWRLISLSVVLAKDGNEDVPMSTQTNRLQAIGQPQPIDDGAGLCPFCQL